MNLLDDAKRSFRNEIRSRAEANIRRKLAEEGLDADSIDPREYLELIDAEAKILENDVKKVGLGFGLGIAFSLFFGF